MKKTLIYVSALICFSLSAMGQDFLKVSGKKIVNQKGENILLKGMGLGGWMLQEGYMLRINSEGQQYRIRERIADLIGKEKTDEFYEAWLTNNTTKADIDSLKAWGFNSVRLPFHYDLYTLPVEKEPVAGQNTWIEKGFKMTDDLVKWCKTNNMYLILDLHAAPGGQGNDLNISDRDPSKPSLWESKANQDKTIALWKKLAERYKNEPTIGAYDIINEPNWGFLNPKDDRNGLKEEKNEPLKKLMVDITKAIREVDKNHIVIIEGNGWGNNYNGILDDGLWDHNMALSFHKYWNYNDQKSIEHIISYRDKLNVPVWVGETGENSNVWYAQNNHILESNNIGWAMWPLKKLGGNNPLQIKSNAVYDKLVNYWRDSKTELPSKEDIYKGLMELARNSNIKNNIVHRDVIDAMIRQPFSNETKPYTVNNIVKGAKIKAVNYDLGTNNHAYFDTDTANYRSSGVSGVGNRGGVYRNDGVDIYKEATTPDTYFVGNMEDGEWLQYTVKVPQAGSYVFSFKTRTENAESAISLIDNSKTVINNLKLPVSGKNWVNTKTAPVKLTKGTHKLRVFAVKGGFEFLEFGVEK